LDNAFDVLRGGPGTSKQKKFDIPTIDLSKGASKKKANPRPAPAKKTATEVVKKVTRKPEPSANGLTKRSRQPVRKAKGQPEPSTSAGLARQAKQSVKNLDVSTKKAAKRITKARQAAKQEKKAANRVPRETVPGTKFALSSLQWSPWKLAMCDQAPDDRDVWQERSRGKPGVRNVGLFSRSSDKAAVYEFAVQRSHSRKKYVVYAKATSGFSEQLWDAALLKRDGAQVEIDAVISQGCQVYVRRALIKGRVNLEGKALDTPRQVGAFLRSRYDYAWRFGRRSGSTHMAHRQMDIGSGIVVSRSSVRKCSCVMCS
jgi:hypothetical protein